MEKQKSILKTCFCLETHKQGFHDYPIKEKVSGAYILENGIRMELSEYIGLKNKGLALIQEPTTNDYHKNGTTTFYQVADANWGMYHPNTFETESEARKIIKSEYSERDTQKGEYDLYWRSRKQVVLKITKTIEVLG